MMQALATFGDKPGDRGIRRGCLNQFDPGSLVISDNLSKKSHTDLLIRDFAYARQFTPQDQFKKGNASAEVCNRNSDMRYDFARHLFAARFL